PGVAPETLTIPASTLYFFQANTFVKPTSFALMEIVSAAPIRVLEYAFTDRPFPSTPHADVLLPTPVTTAPPAIQLPISTGTVSWSWQIGTTPPAVASINVLGNLSFNVSVSPAGSSWLTVSPDRDTAPSTLSLVPNLAGVGPGAYQAAVTLMPAVPAGLAGLAAQPSIINAALTVSAGPLIEASDSNCCFFFEAGANMPSPFPGTLSISSNGTPAAFTVNLGPCAGGNWLTAAPLSGTTPATLTFTANPVGLNLPDGRYSCPIAIQGPTNTLSLAAALMVLGPPPPPPPPGSAVKTVPGYLNFLLSAGTSAPSPQSVTVQSNGNPVAASVSTQSGGNWLTASVAAEAPNSVVSASVNPAGLAPGNYQGSVTITSPGMGSAQVLVYLVVAGLPPPQTPLTATPANLSLTAPVGQSQSEVFYVAGPGGLPVEFTAAATTSDGGTWLTLESAMPAVTPGGIVVEAAANLAQGVYHGGILLTWGNGSLTVPVTFQVTPFLGSPPTMAAIVNSASGTPAAVAPGEIITIDGTALGTAPTGFTLDGYGNVATKLNGTEVLVNGTPAPLIYASAYQLNFIVPYETGSSGVAAIQAIWNGIQSASWGALLAASAPAIFTSAATGVGQGAVLNQDSSVNGPSNAAARGTVIQIFGTGAGQTTPASATGGVTGSRGGVFSQPVSVTIGGVSAVVQYAGPAPGEVAGVLQVNAVAPSGVVPGPEVPISLTIGQARSPDGVTIAVK
ncbi:MAG: hypothetical protein ABI165_16550, partial [Bryobacteraceae bacterium]